jgi:hypothetical protein
MGGMRATRVAFLVSRILAFSRPLFSYFLLARSSSPICSVSVVF